MGYSSTYDNALSQAAGALGMNPEWLYKVIQLESAWNPAAYNKSGAVGLIQFMPATLKDYHLLSPALAAKIPPGSSPVVPESVKQEVKKEFLAKYPDAISQLLGPVITYFKRYKSYPTEQSVYLTVLYPSYRDASLDTVFSPSVQAANPGIRTVGDYVNKVNQQVVLAKFKGPVLGGLAVLTLAGVAYFAMTS